MSNNIFTLSLSEVARAIATKKLSSVEATTVCVDRMQAHGPALDAICAMDPDAALADARTADETLAKDGELMAYRHEGFWQPMDTLREKRILEELWSSGSVPWKVWK